MTTKKTTNVAAKRKGLDLDDETRAELGNRTDAPGADGLRLRKRERHDCKYMPRGYHVVGGVLVSNAPAPEMVALTADDADKAEQIRGLLERYKAGEVMPRVNVADLHHAYAVLGGHPVGANGNRGSHESYASMRADVKSYVVARGSRATIQHATCSGSRPPTTARRSSTTYAPTRIRRAGSPP